MKAIYMFALLTLISCSKKDFTISKVHDQVRKSFNLQTEPKSATVKFQGQECIETKYNTQSAHLTLYAIDNELVAFKGTFSFSRKQKHIEKLQKFEELLHTLSGEKIYMIYPEKSNYKKIDYKQTTTDKRNSSVTEEKYLHESNSGQLDLYSHTIIHLDPNRPSSHHIRIQFIRKNFFPNFKAGF